MPQTVFSADWLKQFSDPYALLGVSVAADDRRILKQYRAIAKQLHPDRYTGGDQQQELATQILARLVNPAYQRLKQERDRAEVLATLRFRVRRLTREQELAPNYDNAQQLLNTSGQGIEVLYEQLVSELTATQYHPLDQFEQNTQQLGELNLVYLRLKMGDSIIREKRTGLIVAPKAQPESASGELSFGSAQVADSDEEGKSKINYARRHYQRAQTYLRSEKVDQAIQELKDAIKLERNHSEYYALLGQAYLMKRLSGMAKVYFRQALKIDPQNPRARRYAPELGIQLSQTTVQVSASKKKRSTQPNRPAPKSTRRGNFLGLFNRKGS